MRAACYWPTTKRTPIVKSALHLNVNDAVQNFHSYSIRPFHICPQLPIAITQSFAANANCSGFEDSNEQPNSAQNTLTRLIAAR